MRAIALSLVASSEEPMSGGRHKLFGSHPLGIIPQTSTIASHLPRAVGIAFALERRRRLGLEPIGPADAICRGQLRRRLDQSQHRARRVQRRKLDRPSAPDFAVALRLRGQRARDQRAHARRLGRTAPARAAARRVLRGRRLEPHVGVALRSRRGRVLPPHAPAGGAAPHAASDCSVTPAATSTAPTATPQKSSARSPRDPVLKMARELIAAGVLTPRAGAGARSRG